MATVAPYQSPARQPFACLDGMRLRNLTNVKNRQNATPITLASPVKRRYSPSFEDVDSENIDPTILNSPSKKAKNIYGNPIKPAKVSHFVLKDTYHAPAVLSRPIITPKRLDAVRPLARKAATPSSAPAAAGRSPKSKRIGILSRRRVSSSPFTRVDPPSFGLSNGMPFSIDAALSGTVSSYKAEPVQAITIPTLEESIPNGWMFDIHEDTPEEETGNVISFSFQTVDISDDESRRASKDDRGKENVPPAGYPSSFTAAQRVTTARSASRQDIMTDEPRTPLGDLDAADFYADGCDVSSYIIVPAERSDDKPEKPNEYLAEQHLSAAASSGAVRIRNSQDGWKDLLAQIDVSQKANVAAAMIPSVFDMGERATDVEIWESESAKGDDDVALQHTFQSPLENTSTGSLDVENLNDGKEDSDDPLIL
ncbi:hypothetical protein MMC18_009407 [Xylographa bjoerkii]|nr:hypothetical protein [Xylographa bjoerkii]MCJ1396516.1 hypothetical protein [Xylographa bjoerkii]